MRHVRRFGYCLLATLLASPAVLAAAFPPVTAEDWAVTSVAGEPGARSVILAKRAKLRLMDLSSQDVSSSLVVEVRRKILVDPSEVEAEIVLPHNRYLRLFSFDGRTVLPDGREIPLSKDVKFERRISEREKVDVTAVAFPAVEKGAILDYRYEMRFDSILFLEPFYLSETVPVRHAEVEIEVPASLQARAWSQDPLQAGLETETKRIARKGTVMRVWADDIPAVPDEPFSPPFATLATQFLLVPTAYTDSTSHFPLMESWATTCQLFHDWYYDESLRKTGDAKKEAKRIGASLPDPRARAEALYRFVRDEITTDDVPGIGLRDRSTVAGTLQTRTGDWAEKALLLHAMLDGAGISSRLVWAGDRYLGVIDTRLANPAWFDRILVAVALGGETVYLDPSVRGLPFGRLLPGLEGTPALVVDRKQPREVVLPTSGGDTNRREATVRLALDTAGALSGEGRIALAGHHVWSETPDGANLETIREAWQSRLEESFSDFVVSEVIAEGSPAEDRVEVRWRLAQREEEVLGDEASLAPWRPLGPADQLLAAGHLERRSPVWFGFADRDSLELTLEWPEGWELEAIPSDTSVDPATGRYRASTRVDAPSRRLVYRRDFDLKVTGINDRRSYEEVRTVFEAARIHDAHAISLVRR